MFNPLDNGFLRLVIFTSITMTISWAFTPIANAQDSNINPEVQSMIDTYSQDILINRKMSQKNPAMVGKHSLFLNHLNRAKVYTFYTNRKDLAVKDFSTAIGMIPGTIEKKAWLIRQRAAEAFLYRSICQTDLGNHELAEADATEAVNRFSELVDDKFDQCEAILVYALKTRAKARSHEAASREFLNGAVEDCDSGIEILNTLLSRDTEQNEFYREQVQEFETMKKTIARRNDTNLSEIETSSTSPKTSEKTMTDSAAPSPLDGFKVGRVWEGKCNQLGYQPYSMRLVITKSNGNSFEAVSTYPFGQAKLRGQIDGDAVSFTEHEKVRGNVVIPCKYEATLAGKVLTGRWFAGRSSSKFSVELKKEQ